MQVDVYIFSYLDELWERLDNKPDFYDYDYEDYNTFADVGSNYCIKRFEKRQHQKFFYFIKALIQFDKFTGKIS